MKNKAFDRLMAERVEVVHVLISDLEFVFYHAVIVICSGLSDLNCY